jgi:hypothetical protein
MGGTQNNKQSSLASTDEPKQVQTKCEPNADNPLPNTNNSAQPALMNPNKSKANVNQKQTTSA